MRDPNRIRKFCNRLASAWEYLPDWRFGQLMVNALGEMQGNGRDPFFPEEDEMIKYLEGYCRRNGFHASEDETPVESLIFLDVDGVLNNGAWASRMYKEEGVHVYSDNILEDRAVRLLKRIVDETGAKIILSSAWRKIPECLRDLTLTLKQFGMEISDQTPYVGGERGDDITAWFERNPGRYRYVILDDDSDMGTHMAHLMQTNFDEGLTRELADKCIDTLKGGEIYGVLQ